jgi:hypothetical protein
MTGIMDRQQKPAVAWLTMASSPAHFIGSAASPVAIATRRPRAV